MTINDMPGTGKLAPLSPLLQPMALRAIGEGNEIRHAQGNTLIVAEKRNTPAMTIVLAIVLGLFTAGIALLIMAILGAFRQHVELVEYSINAEGKMRRKSLKREPLR